MKANALTLMVLSGILLGVSGTVHADMSTAPGTACVMQGSAPAGYYQGTIYNPTTGLGYFNCPIHRTTDSWSERTIRSAQITVLERGDSNLWCRVGRWYQRLGSNRVFGYASPYKSPDRKGTWQILTWPAINLPVLSGVSGSGNYSDYFRCYLPGKAADGANYIGNYRVNNSIIPQ